MPERQRRPMPEEEWERAERAVWTCGMPALRAAHSSSHAKTSALRAPVRGALLPSREGRSERRSASFPPGREGLPGMPERQRRPMPEEEWERASARPYAIVGMTNAESWTAPPSSSLSGQRAVTVLVLVQKRMPSMPCWLMSPKPERFQPPKVW